MNATIEDEAAEVAQNERNYQRDTLGANLSGAGTTLEELVRKASRPSLADLVRRGKKDGLIPVKAEYDFDNTH